MQAASRTMEQRQAKETDEERWKEEEEKRCFHLFLEEELRGELGRELIVRLIRAHPSAAIGMRLMRLLSEQITLINLTLIASKCSRNSVQIRVISSWNLEKIKGNQADKGESFIAKYARPFHSFSFPIE